MAVQQKYTKTNSDNLSYQLKQNRRLEDNRVFETLFLGLFLAACAVGIVYSIYPTEGKNAVTLSLYEPSDKSIKEAPPVHKEPEFIIEGDLETFENIVFTISPFDKRAEYHIDFGNGDYKTAVSENTTYQYTKADYYSVTVTRTKNETSEIIFKKSLNIGDSPIIKGDYNDSNE